MNLKVKTLLCSVVLAVTMSVSAFAQFTDMPSGADGVVIEKAVENGLLTGFDDSTVRPNDAITRAQMATIMVRALGAQAKADISSFGDVSEGDWFYDALAKAVEMEAFKGDGNNLNPNKNITRQEALIVLTRIFDMPQTDEDAIAKYNDWESVADWAYDEVNQIVAAGYLPESDVLRPLENMTRLEFAQIMDNLISVYITESGEYTNENLPEGNILVKVDGVVFSEADIKQNVFIGDGVKGKTVLNNCNTERVIVRGGDCDAVGGTHMSIRAIGKGTNLNLVNSPKSLNPLGAFYSKPGKGNINIYTTHGTFE